MRHADVFAAVPARPRRQACAAHPSRVPSARALPVPLRSTCSLYTGFSSSRARGRLTPKQVEIWPDLPRSKVGKVLKTEVKAQLRDGAEAPPR
jgi:acyl-CoA synthetase (AMP-forming)/AMP-acid ligase II